MSKAISHGTLGVVSHIRELKKGHNTQLSHSAVALVWDLEPNILTWKGSRVGNRDHTGHRILILLSKTLMSSLLAIVG